MDGCVLSSAQISNDYIFLASTLNQPEEPS
jgi:hypothetical protein